ncbi:eukaryotic translation initiation factor 2B subunit delta [Arctopsyche grandis]|uniref:eukaryotic translation initiation factor 2B subunit delta n=1 Tax=Arctopsyche grandis TaxID=121162 RepID=UPI00406D9C6F
MDTNKKKFRSKNKSSKDPKLGDTQISVTKVIEPIPQIDSISAPKRKRNRRKKSSKPAEVVCDILDASIEVKNNPTQNKNSVDILTSVTTIEIDKNETIFADNSIRDVSLKSKQFILNDADIISDKKILPILKENTNIKIDNLNIQLNPSTNMDSKSTEKSRDEIKAEREAKKLAKQLSKNKKKGDENTRDTPNVIKKEPVINKVNVPTVVNKEKILTEKANKKENQSKQDNDTSSLPEKPVTSLEKSKSELKAERRAKQEAQRAAKCQAADATETKKSSTSEKNKTVSVEKTKSLTDDAKIEIKKLIIADKLKVKSVQNRHKVKLFNHLYTEDDDKSNIPLNSKNIPPVIVRLGVQYKSHIIVGSNARCIALLSALLKVIKDYNVPPNVEFSRGLEAHIDECMKFLNSCRPLAVSMTNAIKFIKSKLRNLLHDISEDEAKTKLSEHIDTYIVEQIEKAGEAISNSVNEKIADGDVILTYGCSSLIEKILVDAVVYSDKVFSVVVVAANPWNEGREMLRRLTEKNINCSLVMISALSFVMRKINKVILGAGALLANGYVMARAGTAQIAMVAHAYNVPVLVCCETHKFSERAQTDSFVYNEIGDPDELVKCNSSSINNPLSNWRSYNTLTPLNLIYDVTPPDLVTAVVTELAILPCTSVPVVLRIKPGDSGM